MKTEVKEIITKLAFSIAYDNRTGLVNAIIEYAGDELEEADYIKLAKANTKALRFQLNNILNYYLDN
jgi:hypothetical protein